MFAHGPSSPNHVGEVGLRMEGEVALRPEISRLRVVHSPLLQFLGGCPLEHLIEDVEVALCLLLVNQSGGGVGRVELGRGCSRKVRIESVLRRI